MPTNDYRHAAADYALREVTGTDALAFHEIARQVRERGLSGRALDAGCGAGRSTRFLRALGFEAEGLDISPEMITQARKRDPDSAYHVAIVGQPWPLDDAGFDLVLSTWVALELDQRGELNALFAEIARVLKPGGSAFVVGNRAEFYAGQWVSCEVDFPDNQPPLRSGQRVKARLLPEGVVVTDTFWSDADYRAAFETAGLRVVQAHAPLAFESDIPWQDEVHTAPWVVYELLRN